MPIDSETSITIPGGRVQIESLGAGRSRVRTLPDPGAFCPRSEVETKFPIGLLAEIAAADGLGTCEEIARHEAQDYVRGKIARQINAYFEPRAFAGKRLLDFGCGSGASSFGLAEMLPETEIVGVELDSAKMRTARNIAQFRQLANVRFCQSPSGDALPGDIGSFDYVMLSAVWEHLLPAERPVITRLLWNAMKPGAALLINQTPYRWSPLEHHTTGLWAINYLPDAIAGYFARTHAKQTPAELAWCDWPQLLRRGIRGGTEWEVMRNIRRAGGRGEIMRPQTGSRADLWLQACSSRHRSAKKLLAGVFGAVDSLTGTMPVTHLDVVIRKR